MGRPQRKGGDRTPGLLCCLGLLALLASAVAAAGRDYYAILGVDKGADDRTIKRAYKKQALKWHPDRHSSDKKLAEEKFKDVAAAYETLTDPEKRKLYDRFGEEGLKQGGGGPGGPGGPGFGQQFHGDPFEMFNAFFGGGGSGGQRFQFNTRGGGGQQFQFGGGGFPGMGGGMGGHGMRAGGPQRGSGAGSGGGGGLYEGDANVAELDEASFPSGSGTSTGWVWLAEFYAPWCGHCQQLTPKWKAVAKSLKGVVKVAAVNCDEHKGLCAKHGVRGYPTIKALAPGATAWQDYAGERSSKAIADWAQGLIGSAASVLRKEPDLAAFLAQCGGGSAKAAKGAKGATASWGVCVLLLSDKAAAPALWKALSVAFKGKAAFGFVPADAKAVVAALGPAAGGGGARVVSVCNGDLRTAEAYNGTLKSAQLQRHVGGYTGGGKCASQVVLDASTDLARMKVSQLKTLIAAKGVDCTGCLEKGDFVAALQRWLAEQEAPARSARSEL